MGMIYVFITHDRFGGEILRLFHVKIEMYSNVIFMLANKNVLHVRTYVATRHKTYATATKHTLFSQYSALLDSDQLIL